MQVCHGKRAPLARLRPGDGIVCYSPTGTFRGKDRLQAFTALGRVREGEPYQVDMGGDFAPYRRDVDWEDCHPTPIKSLLTRLAFTAGRSNWGYAFRFGLLSIEETDFLTIEAAMRRSDNVGGARIVFDDQLNLPEAKPPSPTNRRRRSGRFSP